MNTIDGEKKARRLMFENMRDQRNLARSEADSLRESLFLTQGDVETIRAEERAEAEAHLEELFVDLTRCVGVGGSFGDPCPKLKEGQRVLDLADIEEILRLPFAREAMLKIHARRRRDEIQF